MLSRKLTSVLLILSIGLSAMLLIGVQKIKDSAKHSFSHSISGTDLIVGARSGDIQLLLYTVFRQGQPVASLSWDSVLAIKAYSEVDWLVPLSLGDSHKGYPVLGTSTDYFKYYRYGDKTSISFLSGVPFEQTFQVVLGAEVAGTLGYKLGDEIFLSHGVAKGNLPMHKNKPFTVVGILNKTATPIDKTLHIPLEGITAIHVDWQNGVAPSASDSLSAAEAMQLDLSPKKVTGALLGLRSKFSIFTVKHRIASFEDEALMSIIPGLALSQLWNSISTIDTAFLVITSLVVLIAFMGMLLALFLTLSQRKREMAILRALGAHPAHLFSLLTLESLIITVSGVMVGLCLMLSLGTVLKPVLEAEMGLILSLNTLSSTELYLAAAIIAFGVITSFIPGILAYRKGLTEGFISL